MTRVTGQYFVGLDLGQSQDFTAIAVLERAELWGSGTRWCSRSGRS
jgi:phage terminase large subunit-like protein